MSANNGYYGDYRDYAPGGAKTREAANSGFVYRDPSNHGAGQIADDYHKYTDPVWASHQPANPGFHYKDPANPGAGQSAGTHPWYGEAGYNPNDPLRYMDDVTKAYYTTQDPGAYWQQVATQQSGGNQNWADYYKAHFSDYMAQYLQAAEQNPHLQFPDWVTGNVANQVNQGFQLQAPEARGLDYRRTDAGRFNAGY